MSQFGYQSLGFGSDTGGAAAAAGFQIDVRETEATIRARTGDAVGVIAYGTDTYDLYVYDGSAWQSYLSSYKNTYSVAFDGADDYVDCGDDSSLEPANITISAWIKASGSIATYNYIVGKLGAFHGTFYLRYRSSNKFNFFIGV